MNCPETTSYGTPCTLPVIGNTGRCWAHQRGGRSKVEDRVTATQLRRMAVLFAEGVAGTRIAEEVGVPAGWPGRLRARGLLPKIRYEELRDERFSDLVPIGALMRTERGWTTMYGPVGLGENRED